MNTKKLRWIARVDEAAQQRGIEVFDEPRPNLLT